MARPRLQHPTGVRRQRPTSRRHRALAVVVALALGVSAGCTAGGVPTISSPAGATSTPATARTTPATPTASAAPTTTAGAGGPTGTAPATGGTDQPAGDADADDDLPTLPDVTAPAWKPSTRTEELAQELGEHGGSVQLAIDAVNLVTPVPGATPSSLPAGDGLDADETLRLLVRYDSQMAPDQQQAVAGLLATKPTGVRIAADGTVTTLAHGLGKSAGFAAPADPMNHLTDLAGQAATDLGAVAGKVVAHGVEELYAAENPYGNRAFSSFPDPHDPTVWDIVVYPRALDGSLGDAALKLDLARELFEASEYRWNPKYVDQPPWLVDGAAEFAAYDTYRAVSGLPQPDGDWFDPDMQDEPLADRSTDAWALFASLQDSGGDPFLAAFEMVDTGASRVPDLLAAAGIDDDAFASFRSSQTFRHGGSPLPLIMTWPQPDQHGPTDNAVATGNYGVGRFTVTDAGDYSHVLRNMTFAPEVALVTFTADAEVLTTAVDGQPVTIPPASSETFCVASEGCTCPNGERPSFAFTDAKAPLLASLPELAGQNGFRVEDRTWDPDRYCADTPTPAKLVGATAVADPHLTTFDGRRYDLMDLGEFVAMRDPQGGLEIQDRTQPYDHYTSGITAVAIGTGDHRITVSTAGIDDGTWVVRLDGTVTTATAFAAGDVSVTIGEGGAAGGTALAGGPTLTAVWPDGSTVSVTGCCGMWLDVELSPQRAARAVGLLGNGNGNIADDLRLPDGTRAGKPDETFAKAWYVTDQTSLFDYDPGKNTEGYRGPLPPDPPEPTDQATKQCADALGPKANGADLEDCAYDLAATGERDLVAQYATAAAQRARSDTARPVAVTPATEPDQSGQTSAPPTGVATAPGPQAGNTPWLTLSGSVINVNSVPFGTQPPAPVTGSIQLPKDTVLVIKAARCLPSVDVQVKVTVHGDPANSPSTSVYACDPDHYESYDADDNATVTDGEVYVMITTAGVYDLTVFTFNETAIQVAVSFYADPTPTVVSTNDFQSKGFTGTLSGVGDTVLAVVKTGGGMTWTLSGGGTICRAFNYAFAETDAGPTAIGADCWHNPGPDVGIGPGGPIVYLIFSRDPGAQQISLIPKS